MSSGAEVAKETTVMPTTIFGIFSRRENKIAESKTQSPPFINNISPKTIAKYSIIKIPTIYTEV